MYDAAKHAYVGMIFEPKDRKRKVEQYIERAKQSLTTALTKNVRDILEDYKYSEIIKYYKNITKQSFNFKQVCLSRAYNVSFEFQKNRRFSPRDLTEFVAETVRGDEQIRAQKATTLPRKIYRTIILYRINEKVSSFL